MGISAGRIQEKEVRACAALHIKIAGDKLASAGGIGRHLHTSEVF